MLATLVIVFREIFEAALIIGIVAAATQGVLRRGLWITAGVVVGVVGSVIVAGLADVIVDLADGMGQELFNALILGAAVLMLAWHNIWMSRHSRELVVQMKQVGASVKKGGEPMFALLVVIAVAVLREGSEVVLFLYGQSAQGVGVSTMLSGGLAGLAVGTAMGLAMYFGLLRIPTKYLFTVTGWMILLLAAGMASQATKFLVQADILPAWGRMWDTSMILTNDSMTGRLLHTLIGYEANPLGIQMAVYLLTLIVIGAAMKFVDRKDALQEKAQEIAIAKIAMFALVLPLMLGLAPPAKAGPASHVYTPNVEFGETELEFSGGYYGDNNDSVDRTREHKFSVGRGMTEHWFSEVELVWEKQPGTGTDYTGFEWVNIFQLTEPGQHIVDMGVFTELAFPDQHDEANTLEIGPMFQKEFGATVNNLNLIWVRDYGSKADHITTFEYAWQTRVKGDPVLEFGFQAMGELGEWSNMNTPGDQEHKMGPAIFGQTKVGQGSDKVKYNGAVLVGVTDDTPDYTLRFTLEYEIY